MKFYYGGKLLRTSKTHYYTHALLTETGVLVGCSSSKEGCEKLRKTYMSDYYDAIHNEEETIKAIAAGRSYVYCKFGRREYREKITAADTIEGSREHIEKCRKEIERRSNWPIVELTAAE